MPILGIDNLAALGSAFQSVLISGVVPSDFKEPEKSGFYLRRILGKCNPDREDVCWFTCEALKPPDNTDQKEEP